MEAEQAAMEVSPRGGHGAVPDPASNFQLLQAGAGIPDGKISPPGFAADVMLGRLARWLRASAAL